VDSETYDEIKFKDIAPAQALADMFDEYDLSDRPVAITGQICIGRGVTFTSERVQITHAILSHHYENNEDNAYQMVGRVTGNNKTYLKVMPTIYCTREFKDIALQEEKNAMSIGKRTKKIVARRTGTYRKALVIRRRSPSLPIRG
jgi:hypothetical protein